jgi:hypothetical protein
MRFALLTVASTLVAAAGDAGLDPAIVAPFVVTTTYLGLAIGAPTAVCRRAEVA